MTARLAPVDASTLLVLADDLTGATEVAGLGHARGWLSGLYTGEPAGLESWLQLTGGLRVINTDSRQMHPAAAEQRLDVFLGALGSNRVFYKKIDSVLRGPVLAELETFLTSGRFSRVMLLPQNPSQGRTVENGIYRINRVPLEATHFAGDPDYPAVTSEALALLNRNPFSGIAPRLLGCKEPCPDATGIYLLDAATPDEVRRRAASLGQDVLAVGGADFFESILDMQSTVSSGIPEADDTVVPVPRLFLSGSAHAESHKSFELLRRRGVVTCSLPGDRLAEGDGTLAREVEKLVEQAEAGRICALRVGPPSVSGADASARVLAHFVGLADLLLDCLPVSSIYVEGGATAGALLRKREWTALQVVRSWSRGAATLRLEDRPVYVTMKPSSYPWPQTWLDMLPATVSNT